LKYLLKIFIPEFYPIILGNGTGWIYGIIRKISQILLNIKDYEGVDRKKYIDNLRDKFRSILR